MNYWDVSLGDKIPNILIDEEPLNLAKANSVLIYPAHESNDSWLQSWCIIGTNNDFEENLEKIVNEFGCYFVLMQADQIKSYAKLISDTTGMNVRHGALRYSKNPLDRSLSTKDFEFHYQKEYRFYVGECPKDHLSDLHLKTPEISDLLSEAPTLKCVDRKGITRFIAQGHPKVFTLEN